MGDAINLSKNEGGFRYKTGNSDKMVEGKANTHRKVTISY